MTQFLAIVPGLVIPALFLRAKAGWLASPAGTRWWLFAVAAAGTVIGVQFYRGSGLTLWTTTLLIVPIQWLVAIVMHRAFVGMFGHEPRDVYWRGGVPDSLPDRLYMVFAFALLNVLLFGLSKWLLPVDS